MDKPQEIKQKMTEAFRHWEKLKTYGGNDWWWSDGWAMNEERKNIMDLRWQCEHELKPEEYPEEYSRPVTDLVDNNYVARPDEIKRNAANTLRICLESTAYQYVKTHYKALGIEAEIAMLPVEGLQNCIEKSGDLVYMRRYENPESVLGPLSECRQKIMELLHENDLPEGQLSIFDYI